MKIKCPKKLIEVVLPLDETNVEAAREKSVRARHSPRSLTRLAPSRRKFTEKALA